jgi:hypothetical protein
MVYNKAYMDVYREKNKERIKALVEKYKQDPGYLEKRRIYYKEYRKTYDPPKNTFYLRNKEKVKAKSKKYYQEHKETIKKNLQDYSKLYYYHNREAILEKTQKQRDTKRGHPVVAKTPKEYYEANKEKIIAYNREWRKKKKEQLQLQNQLQKLENQSQTPVILEI